MSGLLVMMMMMIFRVYINSFDNVWTFEYSILSHQKQERKIFWMRVNWEIKRIEKLQVEKFQQQAIDRFEQKLSRTTIPIKHIFLTKFQILQTRENKNVKMVMKWIKTKWNWTQKQDFPVFVFSEIEKFFCASILWCYDYLDNYFIN